MHAVTDFIAVWLHRSKDFILNQTLSIRRLSVRVDIAFCLANETEAGLKVEELKPRFPQKINRGGCVKPKCQKDYFDPGVMQSHCLRIKIQSWKWAQQVQFNSQWQRECSEVENSPAATRFTVLSHFLLFCNPSKCRLKRKLHCCFFNLLYSTYKKYVKCSGLSQVLGTHSVHYSFVPLCAISKMIRVFIRVEIVMVKSFERSNLKPDFFCRHLHAKR